MILLPATIERWVARQIEAYKPRRATFLAEVARVNREYRTMTKVSPLPGIPPQMSVLAAMSAGLIPANAQITGLGTGPNNTILADLSSGDTPGAGTAPSDLFANAPASSLTFDSPVKYGGD